MLTWDSFLKGSALDQAFKINMPYDPSLVGFVAGLAKFVQTSDSTNGIRPLITLAIPRWIESDKIIHIKGNAACGRKFVHEAKP